MLTKSINRSIAPLVVLAMCLGILGCEGYNYKHDDRVLDRKEMARTAPSENPPEMANMPDLVEQMEATRQSYLAVQQQYVVQLREIERAYLVAGDTVRADWARQQRQRVEQIKLETYPYLTSEPAEHRVQAAPEQSIPEADEIYTRAKGILDEVRGVPLAGALEYNKKKCRQALELFKQILSDYPKSDKVDDSAFYCGEIYKEYLRDEDPDDELALRYYKWAVELDPQTPHAARFQAAVVWDFRRHSRAKAIELYHLVLETEENGNMSNQRFAATRIEQLSDDDRSHLRPEIANRDIDRATVMPSEPGASEEPTAMPAKPIRNDSREPKVIKD